MCSSTARTVRVASVVENTKTPATFDVEGAWPSRSNMTGVIFDGEASDPFRDGALSKRVT